MVVTRELGFCAETTTSRYWSHRREPDVRAALQEALVGESWQVFMGLRSACEQ